MFSILIIIFQIDFEMQLSIKYGMVAILAWFMMMTTAKATAMNTTDDTMSTMHDDNGETDLQGCLFMILSAMAYHLLK